MVTKFGQLEVSKKADKHHMPLIEVLYKEIDFVDKKFLNSDLAKHRAYKRRQIDVKNKLEENQKTIGRQFVSTSSQTATEAVATNKGHTLFRKKGKGYC